jgi:predicted RNA-binding protein YlxR (DUF448 family)
VVARNSQLVVDDAAVMPGRGAYLHETTQCFQNAVKRRAFGRALRTEKQLDMSELETRLNATVND